MTTIRLIALFRMTACKATNLNADKQRQPELRSAQTDHAAQKPDRSASSQTER